MVIGDKIKRLRKEKGWTQEQLGAMVGVQKAAINKYETGNVNNLKRNTIAGLANALGVDPVWLMDDTKDLPPIYKINRVTIPEESNRRLFATDALPKHSDKEVEEVLGIPEFKNATVNEQFSSIMDLWEVTRPETKKIVLRTLIALEKLEGNK